MLTVPEPLRHNGQMDRAERMAEELSKIKVRSSPVDVIALTEIISPAASKRVLADLARLGWKYQTCRVSVNPFFDRLKVVSGGIIIASRWPIVQELQHVYRKCCTGMDCFACKGVKYCRLLVRGRYVNVFATHLQAWHNPTARKTRLKQVHAIKSFINSISIPTDEPVVIAGDLNIDRYTDPSLQKYLSVLKAKLPPVNENATHPFTSDPATNGLVGNDDATMYVSPRFPNGCYDDYINNMRCSCCPQEWLDYILFSTDHLIPVRSFMVSAMLKASRPFSMMFNSTTRRNTLDLSDHYPVVAILEFNQTRNDDMDDHEVVKLNSYHHQQPVSFEWLVLVGIVFFGLMLAVVVATVRARVTQDRYW